MSKPPSTQLPHRVLAWYGDDFTGSTDVLEVLAKAGLAPVLFLRTPSAADIAAFPGARAIGLAGVSRARTPAWMDSHLPALLAALDPAGASLLHYKVCSTFDSSPSFGSTGRALEIGRRLTGASAATPVVVGAPPLLRYTAFGHLFATADGVTWRIDRHPTMSRHPVTPMLESDLLRHLASQTTLPLHLFDLRALRKPNFAERYSALTEVHDGAMLIDVIDEDSMARAGELVWKGAGRGRFCIGSSGLEYALVEYWRNAGLLGPIPLRAAVSEHAQLLSVSGSCSPATALQIEAAEQVGHVAIRIDPAALLGDACTRALDGAFADAAAALAGGASVIVHTARGPDDPSIGGFHHASKAIGLDVATAGAAVGAALGALMRRLLRAHPLRRIAVAGGDTSGEVAHALGLDALTMVGSLAPGSPLCRAHAPRNDVDGLDGLEIVLKGGQVGGRTFFEDVRRGRAS